MQSTKVNSFWIGILSLQLAYCLPDRLIKDDSFLQDISFEGQLSGLSVSLEESEVSFTSNENTDSWETGDNIEAKELPTTDLLTPHEVPSSSVNLQMAEHAGKNEYLGFGVIGRGITDLAKYHTFVDKQTLPPGALVSSVEFYSNIANRRLHVGIFRKEESRSFRTLKLFRIPRNNITEGINKLDISGGWMTGENEHLGFTWLDYGVVAFQFTRRGEENYYEGRVAPDDGSMLNLVHGRYSNRIYSIRAVFTFKGTASILPCISCPMAYLGNSVLPRMKVDTKTGINTHSQPFPSSGTIKHIQMYSKQGGHGLELQIIRGTREVFSVNIKGSGIKQGANLVTLKNDDIVVLKGDYFRISWSGNGVISYDQMSHDKRIYSVRVGYQPGYEKHAKCSEHLANLGQAPGWKNGHGDQLNMANGTGGQVVDTTSFPMDARILSVQFGVCKWGHSLTLGVFRQTSGHLNMTSSIKIPGKDLKNGEMKICLKNQDLIAGRGDLVGVVWEGEEVVCKHQGAFADYLVSYDEGQTNKVEKKWVYDFRVEYSALTF